MIDPWQTWRLYANFGYKSAQHFGFIIAFSMRLKHSILFRKMKEAINWQNQKQDHHRTVKRDIKHCQTNTHKRTHAIKKTHKNTSEHDHKMWCDHISQLSPQYREEETQNFESHMAATPESKQGNQHPLIFDKYCGCLFDLIFLCPS